MSAMIAVGRAFRVEGLLGFCRSGREMEELRQEWAQKRPDQASTARRCGWARQQLFRKIRRRHKADSVVGHLLSYLFLALLFWSQLDLRGNVDGGVALNSEMTLCRRAVVSGWLLSTGVEKAPLARAIAGAIPQRASRIFNEGWTGEGKGAGQNQMLHVASNQKAVNLDIKMFGTVLLLMLPYPSHLARTKLSKGNKQPYLPVCTNRKGPRQSTRLITALKGPALPRPRPCVLTTIRANLSLVDPAHQRQGTNTSRQARSPAAWKGTQASGTQSVQVHGGSAQTFAILYRRLVPQSDDGLDGSLVDVAVGP